MNEKTLQASNEGKAAQFLLEKVRPLHESERDRIINDMKQMFRSGTHTEAKLLASVAQLCTIDDIETTLRGKIHRGEKANMEIIEGKDAT